jgi:GDP-L-fucose synthase
MVIATTNKKNFFYKKKILVTGGTGMIGIPLTKFLVDAGANVTSASLDKIKPIRGVKYIYADLRNFENCLDITKKKDIVFHLAGIKGSPKMSKEKPASFFVTTIKFSLNMMEASLKNKVNDYLFTSSVGVYAQKELLKEEDVWKTFPSENDRFAGWAKRICELQAQCYEIENKWKNIFVVRPANVYGPYDNFDEKNAMVIPSLISKAFKTKNDKIEVWGDGKPKRDFIFSEDVAKGMMKVVKKRFRSPINLGSGKAVSIKKISELIANNVPNSPLKIVWKKKFATGDSVRLMSIKLSKKINFEPEIGIEEGIKKTIQWFNNNKKSYKQRYNSFLETK